MLFKLIGNENMKIYRRLRTWVLLAVVLVATILVGVVMHNTQPKSQGDWKQQLVQQNADLQNGLNKDGGHLPAAAVQEQQQTLQMNQYYLAHDINPYHHTGWDFASTAQNLSSLVIAFIVVIAGDVVASEFSSGTVKMLLTQTATRPKILLSKYVAAMLFALFMTVALLLFSLLVGGVLFGFAGAGAPHFYTDASGHVQHMSAAAFLFMNYGFLFLEIVITVTIAFMISAIFRSSVLAITISILAYLIGSTLVAALSSFSWVKYILFANTDLSQYVVGGPHIQGMTLGFSITMLVIYFVVMNALSWLIFSKRDVAFT